MIIGAGKYGAYQPARNQLSDVDLMLSKSLVAAFEAWAIDDIAAADLLEIGLGQWSAMKDGTPLPHHRALQARAVALVSIFLMLDACFESRIARQWIVNPNHGPHYRGASPLSTMRAGGLQAIIQTRDHVEWMSLHI